MTTTKQKPEAIFRHCFVRLLVYGSSLWAFCYFAPSEPRHSLALVIVAVTVCIILLGATVAYAISSVRYLLLWLQGGD